MTQKKNNQKDFGSKKETRKRPKLHKNIKNTIEKISNWVERAYKDCALCNKTCRISNNLLSKLNYTNKF